MARGQKRRRIVQCDARRAFNDADRWKDLGDERALEIADLAAALKQAMAAQQPAPRRARQWRRRRRSDPGEAGAPAEEPLPSSGSSTSWLFFRRAPTATTGRVTFLGTEAIDWLVTTTASSRADALAVIQWMLAGNLVRYLDSSPPFGDPRNCRYCFVADDAPRDGPSVAATVPHAVLDGWLTISFGRRCDVYGRAHARKSPRYCVLKRHGRSYVLYYFSTDHAPRPLGFVNLQRSDACQYISHNSPSSTRVTTPSFRLRIAAMDGTQLDLIASAPSQLQVERWIRAFTVVVGASYIEMTTAALPNELAVVGSIHSFCVGGIGPTVNGSIRGPAVPYSAFAGQAVLVVNVDVTNPHASAHFSQLQFLHDEFVARATDVGAETGSLIIVVYQCDQFDATDQLSYDQIREKIAGFSSNLNSFVLGGKVSVNGCGTVGSDHPSSATPRVPPEWAFLKSRLPGDYGTYVTWSFTKFLLDADGVPQCRYEPSASFYELRRGVANILHAEVGESVQSHSMGTGSDHATQRLHGLGDGNLNRSRRADTDFEMLATAWPDLGPYYTMQGDGPFTRGPVTFPSHRLRHTAMPTPQIIRVHKQTSTMDDGLPLHPPLHPSVVSTVHRGSDGESIKNDESNAPRKNMKTVGNLRSATPNTTDLRAYSWEGTPSRRSSQEAVQAAATAIPTLFDSLLQHCAPSAAAMAFETDIGWFDYDDPRLRQPPPLVGLVTRPTLLTHHIGEGAASPIQGAGPPSLDASPTVFKTSLYDACSQPTGLHARRTSQTPDRHSLSIATGAGTEFAYLLTTSSLSLHIPRTDTSTGSDSSSDVELPSPRSVSHTLI
jgi:glutathione peroxidase